MAQVRELLASGVGETLARGMSADAARVTLSEIQATKARTQREMF